MIFIAHLKNNIYSAIKQADDTAIKKTSVNGAFTKSLISNAQSFSAIAALYYYSLKRMQLLSIACNFAEKPLYLFSP
jgi:hypothetical protein